MFIPLLLATTSTLVVFLSYKVRILQKERDRLLSENTEEAKVLFLNSRYASMGETLGNIAHQWKQPLNAIGSIQNAIKAALIFQGDISKEKLLNSVETSFKLLQHLAETIDTFYSFLAQRGDGKISFIIADELEKVRKITEYSFENSNITLNFILDANPTIQGNSNEFTHAILNLILNAKDAFDDSPSDMPIITVHVSGRENYCIIVISDNAGGIRLNPPEMVFDMHITTKESGSGLGLFMTKKIIEQRFGGTITVENKNDGACFKIELPYAEYGEYFNEASKHDEKLTLERINHLSRKVIELEDLEKTLKKWSDIFKQAHWGIAMHSGKDNAFELTNAAFNTLYGYTSEELKSIRVSDLFTPESLPLLSKIQKEAKKKGFVVFEASHKRKDGSIFPASVELIVIKNDSGEVLYHIANIWDMSEKKAAEERLQLKKFALDHIQDSVFLIDENARFQYVNQGACTALGYAREEFEEMNVGDVDPDWPAERWNEHWEVLKKAGSITMELRHRRRDGTIFPVEVSANYIEFGDKHYNMAIARDITERKAAEKELLLVDKALNNTNEAVYIMIDDRFTQVNEGACRMLGYSREEFTDMRLRDIDRNFSEKERIDNIDAMSRGDGSLRHERQHYTKEGRILDVEIITNFFEYEGITYSYSTVRDITEQKKAREELLLKEFALNTIHEAVYLIDENSMIHYVNEDACRELGYSYDELMQMGVIDIDPNCMNDWWKMHWSDVQANKNVLIQAAHRRKDGTIFPIEVSANYIEYNSKAYIFSVVRDITERLLLEEEKETRAIKTIAENVPDNIARWDIEGRYLYINLVQERLLGITLVDIFGKRLSEAFPEIDFSVLDGAIAQVIKTGEPIQFLRQLVPAEDGTMDIHEINLVPERDANGTIVSVLGVGRDMTNIYRLQDELAEREKELRALADSSPGMMGAFHMRPNGSLYMSYVSPNIINIFGLEPHKVAEDAMTLMTLTHPDDAERVYASILESAHSLSIWHEEYRIIHPTKGVRWMESNTKPENHPNGDIVWYGYVHDITERKELEEQLLEQNQFLDSILNAIPVPVFYKDKETRYRGFNKAFEEFYGKKKEEMIGKGVYDLFPPEQAKIFFDADADLFRHGGTQIYETNLRDIRGVDHVVMFHKAVYFDKAGNVIGQIGTILEITERKAMEALLEKEHKFLNDAQRVAHTGSWYLDIKQGLLTWSDETYKIFEFDKEHYIDNLHVSFYECVHPDDREMVNAPYIESIKTKLPYEVEHRIVMRDGRIKYVIERCEHTYDADGTPLYSTGTVQDITDRKLIEKKMEDSHHFLNQLIDSIPDPIFVKDKQHIWVLLNQAFCELIGQSRESLIGKSDYDFFPKEQADIFWEKDEEVFKSNETNINEEYFTSANGTKHYIQTIKTMFESDNKGQHLVGTIRDISERKQAENAIKELNETLEKRVIERTAQLQKSRETFRAIVESSPDVISRYDLQMRRTYVNPLMQFLLGKPLDEILGKTPREFSPLSDVDGFEQLFDSVVQGKNELEYEGAFIAPWGEKRWGNQRIIPEFDEDRNVISVMVIGRDMTKRVEAEKRLKMIEMAVNSSAEAVYINDKELTIIYVNDEACRMLGYSRDELLSMKIIEIDAKYTLQEIDEIIATKIRDGKIVFETQHRRKDGSVIDVEVAGSFFIHEEDTILISLVKEISPA